jgi:hypothetical protein
MKTYKSNIEGAWVEILKVELTAEQKSVLMSNNENDKEAKNNLLLSIQNQREVAVSENKLQELVNFYNTIKPALKETDVYQLISADLSEANTFEGILNCRVNGEHIQIRF